MIAISLSSASLSGGAGSVFGATKDVRETSASQHPSGCSCASCAACTGKDPSADALKQLKARDQEVRAHEAAHLASAGGLARGGVHFTYQRGSDGQQYAIGGSVNIDTSPVSGDPKATIDKARVVRAAALAPSDPSDQDRAVAAAATQMAQQAQTALAQQQTASTQTTSCTKTHTSSAGRRLQTAVTAAGNSANALSSNAINVYA